MSKNLSWRDALKQFNDKRIQEGGKYTIPKKGTPEYASVRELIGEKSDAVPLQPNQTVTGQTVTGQNAPGKSTGKPRDSSKSRTPKPKRTDSEEKSTRRSKHLCQLKRIRFGLTSLSQRKKRNQNCQNPSQMRMSRTSKN